MSIVLVVGDTRPQLRFFLRSGGAVVEALDTADSIVLRLLKPSMVVLEKVGTLEDVATGEVSFTFTAAELDEDGEHWGEVVIYWTNPELDPQHSRKRIPIVVRNEFEEAA